MTQYKCAAIKKHIETLDDVVEFFSDLAKHGLRINPDHFFSDMHLEDYGWSPEFIERLDVTLNLCWEMCDDMNVNIHRIAQEAYNNPRY